MQLFLCGNDTHLVQFIFDKTQFYEIVAPENLICRGEYLYILKSQMRAIHDLRIQTAQIYIILEITNVKASNLKLQELKNMTRYMIRKYELKNEKYNYSEYHKYSITMLRRMSCTHYNVCI